MPNFDVPLGLQANGSTGEVWNINIETDGTFNPSTNGNLVISANSLNGGNPVMFMSDDSGDVGIGTTAPQAKLDVNGSLRVNNGTIFSKMQAGTATIGRHNSWRKENIVVNFPDVFAVTTRAISTTEFRVNVMRIDSSSGWGQNLLLDWFAWQ